MEKFSTRLENVSESEDDAVQKEAQRIKGRAFERADHVSLEEVASHVKLPPVSDTPRIILAVAPCRSGTTAQLRLFSAAGIPAYYQPLKAILRRRAQGMSGDFNVPSHNTLFVKETLGPYSLAESHFNPIDVLLAAGFPKDKLTVIAEMREPLSTVTSWMEVELPVWRNKAALLNNFIEAYKTTSQILKQAQKSDILAIPYLYEAQRDMAPSIAVAQLFSSLQIPFSESMVTGWERLPEFGSAGSNIFYPIEPELYGGDFHDVATHSHGLGYTAKDASKIDEMLGMGEVQTVEQEGLQQVYDDMRQSVAAITGLQVQPSTEIEQFKHRFSQK